VKPKTLNSATLHFAIYTPISQPCTLNPEPWHPDTLTPWALPPPLPPHPTSRRWCAGSWHAAACRPSPRRS